MNITFGEFVISDDKSLLQLERILDFLSKSYWANKRSEARIRKSIENSLCYGVYHDNKQVGFARVVTDSATVYWLCDVFIDEEYRGRSLGKQLVKAITKSEELKDLMGILGTRDAHELYEQNGFERQQGRFMSRRPDFLSNETNS